MKNYLSAMLLFFVGTNLSAQQGLEGIIVEKYYISDSKDKKKSKDALQQGSVTYRVFVDMARGYRFQAAYGVQGHSLKISTSTYFFNNEMDGASLAQDISDKKLPNNSLMIDSWLSVCGGSSASYAVLKASDTSSAIKNVDGLLQSTNPDAGIPIRTKDGLIPWNAIPVAALFGIDSVQLEIFKVNNEKAKGQILDTDNGSWASFGGTIGLDSTNTVLIAQITTDGQFSFELNIQLGNPGGGVENYVARNPVKDEILYPALIYSTGELNKK